MKAMTFRIRHARVKALLSQAALAKAVGVNRSAVAQWERPDGSRPTSENLAKVAVATAVHFEWLATGRGPVIMSEDGAESGEGPALLLQLYAHDEMEERLLAAVRTLEYWQLVAIADLAETFSSRKLVMRTRPPR